MTIPAVLRFGVVGVTQNAVNLGIFTAGLWAGLDYVLAAILAAIVAVNLGFALNRLWTFGARGGGRLVGHALRYVAVYVVALAIGVAILIALVERVGLAPVEGQLVAIGVVAPASFVAQRTWVFA